MIQAIRFLAPSFALLGALIPLTAGSPAAASAIQSTSVLQCSPDGALGIDGPRGMSEAAPSAIVPTCPGDTPDNPLMPTAIINGQFVFNPTFSSPGQMIFIDPPVTIGYTYIIMGALFTSVQAPGNLADTHFILKTGTANLAGGNFVPMNGSNACNSFSYAGHITGGLTYLFPNPASCFQILDIDEALTIAPTDFTTFVTGITVNSVGTFNVSQTPIATPGPLPLLGAGIGFSASRRLRRRIRLSQPGLTPTPPANTAAEEG